MPIPEQDALRAIAVAKANPNDPAVIAKAQALTRAYQAQQEAAGLSMFPEQERRRDEQASTLRSFFTEPNHGLDEDTLLSLNENFRESPDEKFKLFNRKWFEAAGVPRERVEREADELMKIYSEREWGTPSTTHKHFFDRIARDYQTREEVANAAKETSLQNLGVLRSELAFKERFRENSAYVGREQKWDKEFQSLKERFDQKLAPHRSTIKLLSAALMTKEGVGVEDPKTMDEAFAQRREIDNAASYRELAEIVMMVPAEDRKLVIAAAVAASANDEAGRKSVMEGLVEKFDRGLRGGMDSVVSIGERSRAIDVKAAIAEGVEVPAGKAGTPEEYVEAVYQRVGLGDDYEIRTGVMRLVEGMKFAKPTDEVKGQALAMIQERMDAIDLRDELRLAAENDIDPVTSEFLPVRGLYAAAESVPYMMTSMVRGGFAVNAMALAGDSYRSLRAANPTMTAEQAQTLSMLSGPFQAFIEKRQTTLALGQFKAVNRFFNQITRTKGAVASRFLARTTATAGAEMFQENVQDLTPFAIQGLLSALDEDMPEVPWEPVFGDLLKQQPDLFFAVLPFAVIGGGAGTYSDFKGGAELLTSYDLLRATGLSEAAASEVRALASQGNVEGAQTLLRQEFKTLGQDQKSVQEARAEAIPKMIAEREAMQQALNEAGELDILPAILREGEKYTLRYTGGEAVQYDSHAEAFARFEAVASSAVAALHEDMITAARMTTSQIERGREVKFIVSPLRPTTEDMEAQGVATGEDMAQRMEISEADKALTPKTEERKAKAMAGMVANSPEARTAVNYILGSATTADAAPDSFGDRVVRNTVRLYQGATPFTLFEETAEGDAKFMIRELGLRRWMIGALRQWEATSGDALFRASIKEESQIKDQDIVEAYSKMVQGYLAGRAKSGDQGRVFSSRFRKSIADALRGDFGAVLTGYASLFEAVYRRAAMIEKARRDGTFDGDLETFLAKSTGMSEQRLFERDVQREGSAIAQDLSGNPDFSSGDGTETTFSVLKKNAAEIKAEVDAMSSDQIRAALEKATLTPTLQMVELLGEFPEYLEPVVDYIMGKRDALISGNVSVRDVAKAYWITVASIGADAIDVETIRRQADSIGIPFDPSPMFLSYGKKGQPQMRPEELAAWWLGTPEGQTALNNIEAGNFNQSDWETGLKLRDAFGRNDLNEKTTKKGSYVAGGVGSPKPNKFNLRNITDLTDQINASKGNPAKLEKALMSLNNIAEGKKGFIGHMLGFGEWATLDAVELNIWLTGKGSTTYQTESKKRIAAIAKKASGTKALSKDLFGRIRKRINALRKDAQGGMKIPEEVAAHIIHHWIWDKAKGIETTHQGVYHAMETFSVITRDPEVTRAAQQMRDGQISRDEYQRIVDSRMPLRAFDSVPIPASDEDMIRGLGERKAGDILKRDLILNPEDIEEGMTLASRLDIPAYESENVWIVSLHHPKKSLNKGQANKVFGYTPTAVLEDVEFDVTEAAAMGIAAGKPKSTIATMQGRYVPMTSGEAYDLAQKSMGKWTEIGMNPVRHSFFYDKETQTPVKSADMVVQVGGMVLAKNPVFGNREDYTFSVITASQDSEYLDAVERGDMETAQRMVDEAARAAGYNVGPVYHGTMQGDFDQFVSSAKGRNAIPGEPVSSSSFWFTDNENLAAKFAQGGGALAMGRRDFVKAPAKVFDVFLRLNNPQIVDFQNENLSREEKEWTFNGNTEIGFRKERTVKDAKASGRDGVIFKNALDGSTVNGGKIIAVFDSDQIKSADPVTYDEQGNVIPLSQRFNPVRDEITYSLLPDASNLDTEFARMFSPFQRSPELRAKLGMEMRRRVAEQVTKLRPILRANRTKASIEAERKRRQDEIFTEKLDTLSAGEIQALANENLLEDNSLTPILAELLREKTYLTKSGKRVRYWTGSLMSKSEANRRGYDTTGGEWDAVPEGLPPYVYGGSITPDEAATMFDFETPEAFFDALAGEIQSRGDRKQEIEDAKRRVRELEKEARQEARAWADEAMKERKTVGGDRAVLLGFLRTLDAITRALPAEVRGKIGGSVALAKLVTPAAMLDEIESRVERIDVELERYLKKEATEQVKAFFEKVAKSRQTEAGKAAKGKRNLPEIYKVMALAENAFKAMSAEEGQAEGAKLTGLVDSRAVPDDDVAATLMAAELIPLFSGWNGRTQDTVVNGKTTRVRIAEPSDSARKFAALEAAKRIWDGGLLEWKTRQAEIKERRDAVREEGLVDISKANKLRTRDEQAIRGMTRASLAKKIALNTMSVDGFFRWHLGENSKVYQWISDSERQAAFAYDTAVRNISKSVDDWFKDRAGSNLKGQKLRQTMAETYVELTPEKGEKRKLNQLQLITAALIWRQEDGRRHMRGRRDENGNIVSSWSYGDGFIKQVEEAMSEDAVELMQFLSDAYEAEYVPLNKVYRKLFGIDLPRHIFYAPLTVKPEQKNDASVDPLTGFFSGGLSGIAGALKTRGTSTVEPDFRDALQTFLAHSMQMEHFKAFAELAREAKAIFGRVSFQDQIGRASGEEGVTILAGILEQLDKGGVRSSHIYLESTAQLERVIGRLSTIILFGKLQTIALNITQIFAARAEMTGPQFRRQMGKLLFGKLDWIEGFKSPYIQNRVEQMPPVVAQAIQSGRKLGPSIWNEVNDKLGYGIAGSDGWWTAATYVMLYDFKKQEAAKLGMDSVAAEEFARNEAERITDRVAQPTRKGARSVFENNMSPEGRAFMNFFSESRKNLALLAFAFAKDRSKLSGTGQYVILNALIATMIRAAWQDFRDDDEGEDEVIWNPRKLALEIAIDPVYGIPIFGGVLQDTIKAAFGFKTFGGTLLESGQNVIPATRRMVTMDYSADEIDQFAADLNAILGAFGYFSKRAASLAALTNILEDALKVYDNLTQDTP